MRYKRDGFCMKCSVANHKRDERIVEKRVKKIKKTMKTISKL